MSLGVVQQNILQLARNKDRPGFVFTVYGHFSVTDCFYSKISQFRNTDTWISSHTKEIAEIRNSINRLIFTIEATNNYLPREIVTIIKNNCPVRTMKFQRHNRIATGHIQTVQYIARLPYKQSPAD